jgi:hypothetical protein
MARTKASILGVWLVLSAGAAGLEAQVWDPVLCPPLGTEPTLVDVEISIDQWQAKDIGDPARYAHNTKRMWPVLFNRNVEQVSYRFDTFDVAGSGDNFSIDHLTGTATFNGDHGPGTWEGPFEAKRVGEASGAAYLEHRWTTDNSGNGTGYEIDGLELNCRSAVPPPAENTTYVLRNWGYDGVLLDSGDVIWVWTVQPARAEMSILVWPTQETDFDLFVSVNSELSLPSPTEYTHSSSRRQAGSPEMVLLPSHSTDRNVFIAIGSHNGSGQFRFYANVHAAGYPENIRVITDWVPSPVHREIIKTQIRKMAQAVYFSTDGRHLLRRADVYWELPTDLPKPWIVWVNSPQMNQCFFGDHITFGSLNWCGNGCDLSADPDCTCVNTQSFNERWAGNLSSHEFAHCYYDLIDEYHENYSCGHSQMGNYDDVTLNMVDFCDINNGGLNPPPGFTGHAASENNWDELENRFPSTPAYPRQFTPDPFFATCDQDSGDQPFAGFVEIAEHSDPPTVTTDPATGITRTTATLNGTVNPNGYPTTIFFDYGETVRYGLTAAAGGTDWDDDPVPVSVNLTELTCGTTYHFRVRATNDVGTSHGADRIFTTATCDVLELTDMAIDGADLYEACESIRAGPNVEILAPGGCVFRAGQSVELRSSFSVASAASFTVEIQQPTDCAPP